MNKMIIHISLIHEQNENPFSESFTNQANIDFFCLGSHEQTEHPF